MFGPPTSISMTTLVTSSTRRAASSAVLLDGRIADAPREFHDTVMHFYADTARNDIVFAAQLCEDILLDLHIVFHGVGC